MIKFTQAERTQKPARIGILGQTASGKTISSLLLAKGLTDNGKVVIFDTENGRASLKANNPLLEGWNFDTYTIPPDKASPTLALEVAKEAVAQSYDAIIFDSSSHLWDWTLNEKERLGQAFHYWSKAKAPYYKFIREAVINLPIHTILTLRTEMKYEQEESAGKKAVVKLGLTPQGEKNLQYELDFVFNLDRNHEATIEKTEDGVFTQDSFIITPEVGQDIKNWLFMGKDYDPEAKTKRTFINRITELYIQKHEVEALPEEELIKLKAMSVADLTAYGLTLSKK
jgi:hypothetical protein